LKHRPRLYLS